MKMDDLTGRSPTWCPGCGNYGIWAALKNTIVKIGWEYEDFVMVYGVGCCSNMTDFIKSHGFHSLHGRTIPNAVGMKLANHDLDVVCIAGDGDCYGEGGNHFIHSVRGNHDINVIIHDNRIYGLTTGQASPTSPKGFKSKSTPAGTIEVPFNGLAVALTQGASFVAQGFAGDVPHLSMVLEKALTHKGMTVVNVLQPCVTFNKVVTYQFFRERVYKLEEDGHDIKDRKKALERVVFDSERIPIGILYQEERNSYHEDVQVISEKPLVKQPTISPDLSTLFSALS